MGRHTYKHDLYFIEVKDRYLGGQSLSRISKEMSLDYGTIRGWLTEAGIEIRRSTKVVRTSNKEKQEEFLRCVPAVQSIWLSGGEATEREKLKAICLATGKAETTILRWLSRLGWRTPERRPRYNELINPLLDCYLDRDGQPQIPVRRAAEIVGIDEETAAQWLRRARVPISERGYWTGARTKEESDRIAGIISEKKRGVRRTPPRTCPCGEQVGVDRGKSLYHSDECRKKFSKAYQSDPSKRYLASCEECGEELSGYRSAVRGTPRFCRDCWLKGPVRAAGKYVVAVGDGTGHLLESGLETSFIGLLALHGIDWKRYDGESIQTPVGGFSPDFEVAGVKVEVKGYLDSIAEQKIVEAGKQGIELALIDTNRMKELFSLTSATSIIREIKRLASASVPELHYPNITKKVVDG